MYVLAPGLGLEPVPDNRSHPDPWLGGSTCLPLGLVEAALGSYGEYRAEIHGWIERNDAHMAEAEAVWRRRRALGTA